MPLQLPNPKTPLQLYRHLLREATYLPEVIRPFVTGRISSSFRRNHNDPSPKRRLGKASRGLRFLRAACAGNRFYMEHLVLSAFGRRGPRRRELLSRFLVSEPPSDSAALDKHLHHQQSERIAVGATQKATAPATGADTSQSGSSKRPNDVQGSDWLDKWDTGKLRLLLKKQVNTPSTIRGVHNIKTENINPKLYIPEKSIWGLPLAPKPARTKLKKWWKMMAHRTLPPLGKGEWDLLESLAKGKEATGWSVVPRRPVASGAFPGLEQEHEQGLERLRSETWDMEGYLMKPTRYVDRKSSRRRVLLTGVEQANDEFGYAGRSPGKVFSPRSMRRVYARTWAETPKMEKNPVSPGKWSVQFGGTGSRLSQPSAGHNLLFQDVDQNGRRPRPTPSPRS